MEKMRPVATIPRMEGRKIKDTDVGDEFSSDIL
jgi:hypothetical protein